MPTANVAIPVPVSGFGPAVDVSALVGEKTVILSGRYRGAYVLYGSHDGSNFAPLLIFNAGGIESIKQTFSGALSQVKLKSLASNANGASASISGLSVPLDNSFMVIGPVGKGLSGAVDLGNNAYQTDLNFMGFGRLNGAVVVEGSSDGMGFNPIGEFSAAPSGTSLLGGGGIEFSPLGTKDKVRYVRLNVLGDVPGSFLVTIGGAQSDSGGGGGETLADAYLAGVTSVDQTLPISDVNGGKVVFDATGAGFTGHEAVYILGPLGYGALGIGPYNIGIGLGSYSPAVFYDETSYGNVCIGPFAQVGAGNSSVVLGSGATAVAGLCIAIGAGAGSRGFSVSVGNGAQCADQFSVSVGCVATSDSTDEVVIGYRTYATGQSDVVVGAGAQSGSGGGAVVVGGNAVVGDASDGTVIVGVGASGWGLGSVGVGSGVVVGTNINPVEYSVAVGFECDVQESLAIAVGYQVSVALGAVNSVVVGQNSSVGGVQSLVVGYSASSGVGSANVVVGSLSTVGGVGVANTLVGYGCYVGDSVGETRDFHNNVRVGGGNGVYANYSVVLGNNCVVGDTDDANIIGDCVAVGTWSAVTGSYGMAFGLNASAGEHEVVFGDGVSNEGYVKKFHIVGDVAVNASGTFSAAADSVYNPGANTTLTAVGSLPAGLLDRQAVTISGSAHYDGVWYVHHVDRAANKFDISTAFAGNDSGSWANVEYADLFSFDKTRLTGADTTVMTLLIEKHSGGVIAAVPVTLSAPVSGHSYLQVANS